MKSIIESTTTTLRRSGQMCNRAKIDMKYAVQRQLENTKLRELKEKENNLNSKNKTALVSDKFQSRKVQIRKVTKGKKATNMKKNPMLEAEDKIKENQEKQEDDERKDNEATQMKRMKNKKEEN